MNILAVDDDLDMRQNYELMLGGQGHDLTCVANREDAIAALKREKWDAVLLDQNLLGPGGGPVGLDLVEMIRSYSPAAAILVVSGARDLAIQRAFELGVDDYLVKDPHLKPMLVAKLGLIDRMVQQRRQLTQTDAQRESLVQDTWRALQGEQESGRKGRLLEDLLVALFRGIPGVREVIPRLRNDIEEIDVFVGTHGTGVWSPFQAAPYVLVECKNWSSAVGRNELDAFEKKLERRHGMARLGLFVAWSGVSKPFKVTAMHSPDHVVVVVDRRQLSDWVAAGDRAALLQRWIDAAVTNSALDD